MEIEAINLITGAIAAGAAASAKETASTAVKDAYGGLKALIQKLFADKSNATAETALVEYEKDPGTWEKPLTKALVDASADKTPDIMAAVETLKQVLDKTPGGPEIMAKFNIKDSKVAVVGDGTVIHGNIIVGG